MGLHASILVSIGIWSDTQQDPSPQQHFINSQETQFQMGPMQCMLMVCRELAAQEVPTPSLFSAAKLH